jgi:hypothetical protein
MHGSLLVPRLGCRGETSGSSWVACKESNSCEALALSYKNDIWTNELFERKVTYKYSEYRFHLWSKHFVVEERQVVSVIITVLLTCLELIRSCPTKRSFSMPARPRRGVSCSMFLGSLLMWMFDINATNTVASECKTSTTLSDPLHKLEYNENHRTIYEENSKLKTTITSPKTWSALWAAAEFGVTQSVSNLNCEPSKLCSLRKKVGTNNFTFHHNKSCKYTKRQLLTT